MVAATRAQRAAAAAAPAAKKPASRARAKSPAPKKPSSRAKSPAPRKKPAAAKASKPAEKKSPSKAWTHGAVAAAVIALCAFASSGAPNGGGGDLGSGQMFDRIAPHYDLANKFMSLGLDQGWRRAMVAELAVAPTDKVLDLATGTADVALLEGASGAVVLGVDPSANMLAVGRTKVAAAGLEKSVTLELGDATALTLPDSSYDKLSISFGIRNIPDIDAALREMHRVAKPGATLAVMEFAFPESGPLAPLARLFISFVVPRLGALLSGARWDEYAHLARSIAAFPSPSAFRERITAAGFAAKEPVEFAFGAVVLYVATAEKVVEPEVVEEEGVSED